MSLLTLLLLALTLYLLLTHPPLPPATLLHPTYPSLPPSPSFSANNHLSLATAIQSSPSPVSPETAFAHPSTGEIFATDSRGLLWTVSPDHTSYTLHSTPGGTLLGGAADPSSSSIYVCDATRGLLRIPAPGAPAEIVSAFISNNLTDRVTYCDDVSISPDGTVYFTSATALHPAQAPHDRFPDAFASYITDTLLGTRSGRVLAYDPNTGETSVIADGFAFANGIAVHGSGDYAIVAETATMSLWKVQLKGDQCGRKVLWKILPGLPDGVSYDAVDDVFWAAFFTPVPPVARVLEKVPAMVRRLATALPQWVFDSGAQKSAVAQVRAGSAEIARVLVDEDGVLGTVTAAHRCGDALWLGRLGQSSVAKLELGKLEKV